MSPTYSICKNHGYLSGEHFTCPHCGETAEVYSRITGYYRPVQNWNAGKTEEYKARKEYDLSNSVLTHENFQRGESVLAAGGEEENGNNADHERAMIFATKTCPNCRIAYGYLDKAGVSYEKLMADENADLVKEYGITQAPTLVIKNGSDVNKYTGAGEIRKFLMEKEVR